MLASGRSYARLQSNHESALVETERRGDLPSTRVGIDWDCNQGTERR